MLKYVVILLDETSASYCHADNRVAEPHMMSLSLLKDAIFWAMKENLMVQFVYPDYELPIEYEEVIDSIDHVNIGHNVNNDVIIIDGITPTVEIEDKNAVLRVDFQRLIRNMDFVVELLHKVLHLSVIITDIERMTDQDFDLYKQWLSQVSSVIEAMYASGYSSQLNLLTDRMALDKMKNCNAGWESITIAPNGRFYICPAFYYNDSDNCVGSIYTGLDIKNAQLYQFDHAPICRICDAYQCHRCVWLNKKLTREVNTPSHQQCVIAHIERNASREMLWRIRQNGLFLPGKEIKEINYLDPFDKIVDK